MQASDSSLGPYLRSEREQQGIDIEDIASMTKIQPKFIEALEADHYDQLPKGPFVIGFLRSYAQCLSLDADEVIAFFQTHYGKRRQILSAQQRPSPISPMSWQRGLILSMGLLALVWVLFFVLRSGPARQQAVDDHSAHTTADKQPDTRQVMTAPAMTTPSSAPPEATASNAATLPTRSLPPPSHEIEPLAIDAFQPEAAPPDVPIRALSEGAPLNPAPLVLRVQALEETWMRLDIDGETRQEALIKADQRIEWKANEQFLVTIGNVKGVRVFLNDQELDLPKTRSNVLRDYVLTRALLNSRRTD